MNQAGAVIPVVIPPSIGPISPLGFVDSAGYVWQWDTYDGVRPAAVGQVAAYYATTDCSGTGYLEYPVILPARFTFTLSGGDTLVHAFPDAPSSQTITVNSYFNGSCTTFAGPSSMTVILLSATLPATPITTPTTLAIGDTLHPVYTP
jgi:hypothetical protein